MLYIGYFILTTKTVYLVLEEVRLQIFSYENIFLRPVSGSIVFIWDILYLLLSTIYNYGFGLSWYWIIVTSILSPLMLAPQAPYSLTPQTCQHSSGRELMWTSCGWESARSLHLLWVCWIHLTGDFVVASPHFPCTNSQSHCFVNHKKLETYNTSKQSIIVYLLLLDTQISIVKKSSNWKWSFLSISIIKEWCIKQSYCADLFEKWIIIKSQVPKRKSNCISLEVFLPLKCYILGVFLTAIAGRPSPLSKCFHLWFYRNCDIG